MIFSKNIHDILLYLGCTYFKEDEKYHFKYKNFKLLIYKNNDYNNYQIKFYEDIKYHVDVYDAFFETEIELYNYFKVRYPKKIRKYKVLNCLNDR